MSDTKFQIEQKIVYPSHGVGKILEIFEKNFRGSEMLYYKIYIEVSDMIVMVPVEKAEELGIREVVSADEALAALELLSDDFEPILSDWKLRYQKNLELLKKGAIADIAKIVRNLYNRSKIKELPILERKLYDLAKKLLIDEVCLATGINEKDVESRVHTKLEPPGSAQKIKHIIEDLDDEDDDLMDDVNGSSKSKGRSDDDEDDDDDDESSDSESLDNQDDFDEDDED
ncbi:MAG: CarD family transcriptional regulator [Treponema sp.]|nr:CarD family transcriptional regulator [Treponema sp.]MDE6244390.1 CarD family transcriptional regulator [Treponemataceae bacterium]MBD5408887.1 CarD family transcriptional regulator [Treponema sp.]MBD5410953.1 CarD family transcriptional regulator [Treponema sp.]MBD5411597.1 CarD family transcriptional regulator [Treponema sp.]